LARPQMCGGTLGNDAGNLVSEKTLQARSDFFVALK
jgi:hypothetical protein